MEFKKKERFENISTFLKVVFAFGLSKFIRKKSNRKIVLVGGNLGEKYEDNASVFHRYLVENYQKELDILGCMILLLHTFAN